jgi:saccharopine dehydrogenase-like NADP-dependent oxidoreductase
VVFGVWRFEIGVPPKSTRRIDLLRSASGRAGSDNPGMHRQPEPDMPSILIVGGGKIGQTIAELLAATGQHQVTLADRSAEALAGVTASPRLDTLVLDAADGAALRRAIAGRFAVISAAPFQLTVGIAEAARDANVHYLDLTEDVASTRRIREIADGANRAFIPQCGLAPGFVAIVAADLARRFDGLDSVKLRVGALPAYPSNALGYNLTWSTAGVINEYIEPCEAIVQGVRCLVPALEEREEFALDGVRYEAFNTSGGLGTLAETLAGRVRTLNYRTIRYPGHAAIMKTLLHDLRLRERRELLADILEYAVPATLQDVVVVLVTVSGMVGGRLMQESWSRRILGQPLAGRPRSAIQITTAASACAMLDLLTQGRLPQRGFVRQEDVALPDFLSSRFGAVFSADEPAMLQAA